MAWNRRQFILMGLGALMGGCAGGSSIGRYASPSPPWPAVPFMPRPQTSGTGMPETPTTSQPPREPQPPAGGLAIQPRHAWTREAPIPARMNRMLPIQRITVHHSGFRTIEYTGLQDTIQALNEIRNVHVRDNGWGDIGYHYIIDRAGRIWEGRPVAWQGAHVRAQNEHNLGVMLMGNFDNQAPSREQLEALHQAVRHLRHAYRVAQDEIVTHQELMATRCPGVSLQGWMNRARQAGAFA